MIHWLCAYAFAAISCVALIGDAAHAQAAFPTKPVRFIVSFPAGGPSDVVARLLAPRLGDALGQQVIVENRAGAGGAAGTEFTVRAPADGHTITMGTIGGVAIAPMLNPKIGYHALRDLAPVTQVVNVSYVLSVHPSVPVKTTRDFIALAQTRAGKLNYGSSGPGTGGHLAGELMKMMSGIDMVHVPYKGSGPAQTALIAGEVDMTFENFLIVMPQVKAGRVRPIAMTGERRSRLMPELPTIAESALPGYSASGWYGVLAPAATPKDIITRLNSELTRIIRTPDVSERLNSMAAEPAPGTPEQFGAFLRAEIDKWAKVVAAAKMKAD